jgi:hypothetical protein
MLIHTYAAIEKTKENVENAARVRTYVRNLSRGVFPWKPLVFPIFHPLMEDFEGSGAENWRRDTI